MWLCGSQRQKIPNSSSLAGSAALELSLPLLWRGFYFFFFLFFYMQIKLRDYCGLPSLLKSAVSLLSLIPPGPGSLLWAQGRRCRSGSFSQSPFPQLLRELSRCWWGQGALCTQQVQEELAPVKQELGNDLIDFAADEPVLVKAQFPGACTVVWHWELAPNLNPSYRAANSWCCVRQAGAVPVLFLEDVGAICPLVKPGQPFQGVWRSPGKCKPWGGLGSVEHKFFSFFPLCHVARPAREGLRGWICWRGLWRFLLWWGLG